MKDGLDMPLAGQRYVSAELAHFVGRGLKVEEQYSLLLKILHEGWITHPPHNPNLRDNLSVNTSIQFSSNKMYAPEIVCFCDIPAADFGIYAEKYSPFGLSFSKDFILQRGGCPVFYIPLQAMVHLAKKAAPEELIRLLQEGGPKALYEDIFIGEYFDRMMNEYNRITPGVPDEHKRLIELERFLDYHIFSYIKFYDHTYAGDHDDNSYMEREWRVVGNVNFSPEDIKTIFLPRAFAKRFRADFPSYSAQLLFV